MNCKITENYFAEKARMTENCQIPCGDCPLSVCNNDEKITCIRYETKYTDRAVEIVQQWSNEHPRKTIMDDFLEKYPNAKEHPAFGKHAPTVCAYELGYVKYCCRDTEGCPKCEECWQTPLDEVIEK